MSVPVYAAWIAVWHIDCLSASVFKGQNNYSQIIWKSNTNHMSIVYKPYTNQIKSTWKSYAHNTPLFASWHGHLACIKSYKSSHARSSRKGLYAECIRFVCCMHTILLSHIHCVCIQSTDVARALAHVSRLYMHNNSAACTRSTFVSYDIVWHVHLHIACKVLSLALHHDMVILHA